MCYCPERVDTWAGLALARAQNIMKKLDQVSNDVTLHHCDTVLYLERCTRWNGGCATETSHAYFEVDCSCTVYSEQVCMFVCVDVLREHWPSALSIVMLERRYVQFMCHDISYTVYCPLQYGLFCYTIQSYCAQIIEQVHTYTAQCLLPN